MKGQLMRGARKPLQIEIVEDDIFERHRTSREPQEESDQEMPAQHHISNDHRLSKEPQERMLEESEESSVSLGKPKEDETYRQKGYSNLEATDRLPEVESESPTLKYRVQLLQEELRKQQRQKQELYSIVNDMSRKKQELDRLCEEEHARIQEMEQLQASMNRLKQINRRLQDDLREEREYSKKLEEEIKDAMNYKNTGLKVESYLQRRNNENREVGNIKVKDVRLPRGSRGQF